MTEPCFGCGDEKDWIECELEDCPSCDGGLNLDPLDWHGCFRCGGCGEVRVYLPDVDDDE